MFGAMFTIIPFFVFVIFAIVICTFIVTAVKGVGQWNQNNQSPVITTDARLVTKRTQVSHHTQASAGENMPMHSTSSTRYYVTFEVESGSRMEFNVSGHEYGMLAEGDCGKLTFQGTRYQGFERIPGAVLSRTVSSHPAGPAQNGTSAHPMQNGAGSVSPSRQEPHMPAAQNRPAQEQPTASSATAPLNPEQSRDQSPHGQNPADSNGGQPPIEFFFSSDEPAHDNSTRPPVTVDEMEADRRPK